jgi:curved DNA-binding protein
MVVEFQDYYQILNIPKTASPKDIQKAYRRLAKIYHPDINKNKDAEEKFKKITEAYEVLRNEEARKRYDLLGARYQKGEPFSPQGEWHNVHVDLGDLGFSGFSTFFEHFFRNPKIHPQNTREAIIQLSLEEAMSGCAKELIIEGAEEERIQVNIPAGATQGARIHLPRSTKGGGITLVINIKPHPIFQARKRDLYMPLSLSPWEAALGADIKIMLLDKKSITLHVPPGIQNGNKLRVKGKGLPAKNTLPGDLFIEIHIKIPTLLSDEEKALLKRLKDISQFNPRA